MNRETLDWTWREIVRFVFRQRTFESRLLRISGLVLIAIFGGNWAIGFATSLGGGTKFDASSTNVIPEWVQYPVAFLCLLGIAIAVWMGWTRFQRDHAALQRKKVLVIEGRGLQADDGAPLMAAIPDSIIGNRIPISLNLRQGKDGVVHDPQALLPEVDGTRRAVHQHTTDARREDLTIVYGGLTPVPFTFLTGVLLDDEGSIVTMDWDRTQERWRTLDSEDDGLRFQTEGLADIGQADEVVLAVSASYPVLDENIATTFRFPVVRMTLPDLKSPHWSRSKQSALAEQFLNVAKELEGKGVKVIHLILAAQNSVAFNLGRRYDKRNLPRIVVYQFERGAEKKYPWGVRMPVSGNSGSSIARPS